MYPTRPAQSRPAGPVVAAYHERRSQNPVEDGLIRHRIALLPFDDAEVLSAAAQDLVMNGFMANQFCVLGPADKLLAIDSGRRSDAATPGILADLWLNPVGEFKLNGDRPVAMLCGHRAAALFGPTGRRAIEPDWIRPDLSRAIARSVEQGRLVLLVTAHSATQHALGARLLLRHGKHDLQTHEFSAREPS